MPRRRLRLLAETVSQIPRPPLGEALRKTFREGYRRQDFTADILAGLVVGIVALPLSMALAIAIGAPPERGLYTAIVAGGITALLGGSRHQVTGPTAAFIVVLAPIVKDYGITGLLVASVFAGMMLAAMGIMRLGKLIEFIPHPVTTGFTTGIAVVIATLQLRDAFGLTVAHMPDGYLEKIRALWHARATFRPVELAIAATTLTLLLVIPKFIKKIPAPLLAIGAVTIVMVVASRFYPQLRYRAIPDIPRLPPHPHIPWGEHLTLAMIRAVFSSAFAIAMLGAIESLLSAVIADGMTGERHDPDAELLALGIGNMVAPFFGGIPATGALARTATNVRAGARSPIAAVVHSVFVLAALLVFAPLMSYVPLASLAALLLLVAWNMSERKHFAHILAIAPKSDVFVLLTCFFLTVFFDMVIAVSIGVVLAALLFMRRMAELTSARLGSQGALRVGPALPPNVVLYEIGGPLFFGAATRAMEALADIGDGAKIVIVYLGSVPVIDATGLVALESAVTRLVDAKKQVIIAGPLPQPQKVWEKAQLGAAEGVTVCETLEAAAAYATEWLQAHGQPIERTPSQLPPSSRRVSTT